MSPKFVVPAGVPCEASRVGRNQWVSHTTTGESVFDNAEGTMRPSWLVFRRGGWLLRVDKQFVQILSPMGGFSMTVGPKSENPVTTPPTPTPTPAASTGRRTTARPSRRGVRRGNWKRGF